MDYIPLSSKKMKNKTKHTITNIKSHNGSSKRPTYCGDAKLVPRIQEYLDSNKQKKYVDLDDLTNYLQQMFSDYGRKKKGAFRGAVTKALHRLKKAEQEEQKSEDQSSSSSEEHEKEAAKHDKVTASQDKNLSNKGLVGLYGSGNRGPATTASGRSKWLGVLKKVDQPIVEGGDSDTEDEEDGAEDQMSRKPLRFDEDLVHKIMKLKRPPSPSAGSQVYIGRASEDPIVDPIVDPKGDSLTLTRRKRSGSTISLGRSKEPKQADVQLQQSSLTFADIGGYEKVLVETCKLLFHMKHPEIYDKLGVKPPRGFLLHGPPGCGKTLLAHAIAGELGLPFIKVAATEIVTGVSGESEEKIRDLFEKAVSSAPCILFIDEIDAITPKRETAQREMERRIVAQLLTCMDDLNAKAATLQVLVIGATNRADSLDPALRRAGRFDHEISMGIPDEGARIRIMMVLCRDLRLEEGFDFKPIARNTPGYVGADLMGLTREAAMNAVNRVFGSLQEKVAASCKETVVENKQTKTKECSELTTVKKMLEDKTVLTTEQLDSLYVLKEDFEYAIKVVKPSSKREGFATIPDVTWDDIGALKSIRQELQLSILAPINHPEQFQALGLTSPAGILLCGPPGCGKTLLAKAIANESGVNFISVKGPELLNMYVGESERAVRLCFQRAQNSSPCVIFFDEIDALCPKRSDSSEHGSSARVVNQLLTEMDGLDTRKYVFLIGATNRPDILDPAVLRPGRLDKIIYVGFPTAAERVEILKTITKNGTRPPCASDVDFHLIGYDPRCHGFTGADLAALVREATVTALKESIENDTPPPSPKPVHTKLPKDKGADLAALVREATVTALKESIDNDAKKPDPKLPKKQGTSEKKIVVTKQHFQSALGKIRPSVSLQAQMEYSKMQLKLNIHAPSDGSCPC